MSDIVERLRRGHHNADLITVGGATHDGRCLVAADEITRLRDDLAAAQEREQRMREALEKIAKYLPSFDYVGRDEYGIRTDFPGSPYDRGKADASKHLSDIARAALSAMRGEP